MAGSQRGIATTRIDRAVEGWMRWVMARAGWTLAVLAGLMFLSALSVTRLGVDADSSKMLSPDLPAQQRAHALNQAFPMLKSSIVIVVRGETADTADLAAEALITALQSETEHLSDVFAVASDPFMATHGFLFRDTEAVSQVFTRISKSANLVAQLRVDQSVEGFTRALDDAALLAERADISTDALERLFAEAAAVFEAHAEGEPRVFGWSAVLDDDADPGPVTRVITLVPKLDLTRLSPAKPALQAIDRAVTTLPPELTEQVSIGVTGEPALRAEEMQSVLGTIGISLGLSLVLVALILRIGLGSGGRAFLSFASLFVSLVLTTGFAALTIGTLNLVSVAFIVLMVGLGIDFAIHILAHVVELRRLGTQPGEAVALTGQRTGLALGLSALTTSLAFLAFAVTDFDGMAQLGLIGGAGVLIAFAVAATLIPAAVAMRPSLAGEARDVKPLGTPAWIGRAAPFAALAVGLFAILPASQTHFDADPMVLRDPATPSVQAFRHLADRPETSPYRASVLAASAEDAAAITTRFENIPGIGKAISIQDLIPENQTEKLTLLDFAAPSIEFAVEGEPAALSGQAASADPLRDLIQRLEGAEGVPGRLHAALTAYAETRDGASDAAVQVRLFRSFPLMLQRLEALLDADVVDQARLPTPLSARFVAADGTHRVEVLPETEITDSASVSAFARTVAGVAPEAAGGPNQLTSAAETVGRAMLFATLLAAFATAVLAFSATRRASDTLAILAPLVVAGMITAGAGVLLDMPFNYANVIVLPLLIGIGVDSGIHIALRERRAPGAVFATSTPRAVLFSALTTMAAFSTLALSDHRGTASMGVLLAVSMCAAVGCVLALTPALMRGFAQLAGRSVRSKPQA